jgi:hypothetical protein
MNFKNQPVESAVSPPLQQPERRPPRPALLRPLPERPPVLQPARPELQSPAEPLFL